MGIWSRVGAVVALLALPLALAVGSQALAERPGAPAMPDQPVELVEADPTRQPVTQPSGQSSTQPTDPDDDGGPRVVTPSPSVPLDTDDESDDGDDADEPDDADDADD